MTVHVRGVGEVDAWCDHPWQMYHGGTVAAFERAGFAEPSIVVMRNEM